MDAHLSLPLSPVRSSLSSTEESAISCNTSTLHHAMWCRASNVAWVGGLPVLIGKTPSSVRVEGRWNWVCCANYPDLVITSVPEAPSQLKKSTLRVFIMVHVFQGNVGHLISDCLVPLWATMVETGNTDRNQNLVAFVGPLPSGRFATDLFGAVTAHKLVSVGDVPPAIYSQVMVYPSMALQLYKFKQLPGGLLQRQMLDTQDDTAILASVGKLLARVRDFALGQEGADSLPRPGHVCLVRRRADRKWTNFDEVAAFIREKFDKGVATLEFSEGQSLSHVIKTVRECETIMGMTGAGLIHAIWAGPKTRLIMAIPGGLPSNYGLEFGNWAMTAGVKYVTYQHKDFATTTFRTEHEKMLAKENWNECFSTPVFRTSDGEELLLRCNGSVVPLTPRVWSALKQASFAMPLAEVGRLLKN